MTQSRTYRWVPGRTMQKHVSFCQELIVQPGTCIWSLATYINLSPMYNMHVLSVKISYQAWFCIQISYLAILFSYNVNGIFKPGEFYHSRPSAGNKRSVHTVSFPAGHMHLHPSAGHITIHIAIYMYKCYSCPSRSHLHIKLPVMIYVSQFFFSSP